MPASYDSTFQAARHRRALRGVESVRKNAPNNAPLIEDDENTAEPPAARKAREKTATA